MASKHDKRMRNKFLYRNVTNKFLLPNEKHFSIIDYFHNLTQ